MSFNAALRQPQRQQAAIVETIPAPIGGVNARDALAEMPPTDAIIADNWFCRPSYLEVRNGSQSWVTGLPAAVETVMAYNGLTARKLFCVSQGKIYDITTQGSAVSLVSGLGTSRLQHAMFNSGSGNVLIWADGTDVPQYYNGSAWANTTINASGLTPSNLITVTVHQQRCWYIENNTMNVWYTAPQAFQGAVTLFPLGQLFRMGGTLMQMASWTIDNVAGINDYAAFITTEGEVALYQGYDPSQQSTWSLVGIFQIGRPIGRRCITKFGSDVLCLTADGLTPLSKALLTDRTMGAAAQVTYKIVNAISLDMQNYAANFGWQVIYYPLGNKLIVNVPENVNTTMHQWVKNTTRQDDGGWSRFRNWNANCWEVQQDALYYGGSQAVYLADSGNSDAGMAITVDCKPAFSYFNVTGQLKIFEFARPVFQSSQVVSPAFTVNVDFADLTASSIPLFSGTGSLWDVSPWDITPWGDNTPSITVKNWIGVSGYGYAACGRVSMQVRGVTCQWYSTDYMFQLGGPL
jgi:hypothetical protein